MKAFRVKCGDPKAYDNCTPVSKRIKDAIIVLVTFSLLKIIARPPSDGVILHRAVRKQLKRVRDEGVEDMIPTKLLGGAARAGRI